jgi:hypothetical protein
VAIPVAVFFSALVAALSARRVIQAHVKTWAERTKWQGLGILRDATRIPSIIWTVIPSAWLALLVSETPGEWKDYAIKGLWTLFVVSLTLCVLGLTNRLVQFYAEQLKASGDTLGLARQTIRVAILVVALATLLVIWGVPLSPVILALAALALVVALALRDTIPNLFAGLQLDASGQIKAGDYIRLESGEEGLVSDINWRNTLLKSSGGGTIIIPNDRMVRSTITNFGRPSTRAKQPFQFHSRVHIKELTGLKASNLSELADVLKTVPDSVVYLHTHHFLEEHHYLTPEPSNDLAIWVSGALGEEVLGERLASVDTFEFTTLQSLKERYVSIIEEYLSQNHGFREAGEGREFHFLKSVSFVLPTPYVANDMREFVGALRQVSLGSLYFHVFESRLRLGSGMNDFSAWLADSMDKEELAQRIARVDPYTYTLEGLRSLLVQLVEKEIQ